MDSSSELSRRKVGYVMLSVWRQFYRLGWYASTPFLLFPYISFPPVVTLVRLTLVFFSSFWITIILTITLLACVFVSSIRVQAEPWKCVRSSLAYTNHLQHVSRKVDNDIHARLSP